MINLKYTLFKDNLYFLNKVNLNFFIEYLNITFFLFKLFSLIFFLLLI